MTLYDTLGVPPDASPDDIKRAHRRAVGQHHPDRGGDREQFEAAQRAYMVLYDPAKRAEYDRSGKVDDEPDNALRDLTECILPAFDQALQSAGERFEMTDIIAATRSILSGQIVGLRQQIAEANQIHRRYARARKRLKHKGDGFDFIGRAMDDKIRQVLAEIEKGEAAIDRLVRAINHLDQYGWDVMAPPPPPPPAQFYTNMPQSPFAVPPSYPYA